MKKKLGPLPIWVWVAVAGTVAFIAWKFSQNQEPEVEGYYPAERAEPPEAAVPAGGMGGLSELGDAISALGAAGFVPAGSELAKAEPPEREFIPQEVPEPFLEYLQGQIGTLKAQNQKLAKRLAKKGGGGKGKKKGKGGGRGKGKGKGRAKGNAQSRAPSSKNPRHTARPDHGAARHPNQRQRRAPRPRSKARR